MPYWCVCRYPAPLEEKDGDEQQRDEHGVVHGVVHGASLDAPLEVVVREPEAADAERDRRTERDQHDHVDQAEPDAPEEAVEPVERALPVGQFFSQRERR